jgi:CheY-like chemotaxis protein
MTLVLVADDVQALAEQYAYDLRRLGGCEALVTTSGQEALDVLEREPVDCLVLDLEMPGMDGFAVLRALREPRLDVPVVVYTGTGNYDRCVQAVQLGAAGFIDKADPMERVWREVAGVVEAVRLDSTSSVPHRLLGRARAELGEFEEAEREYQEGPAVERRRRLDAEQSRGAAPAARPRSGRVGPVGPRDGAGGRWRHVPQQPRGGARSRGLSRCRGAGLRQSC